mmetsp:Transcript_62210/g.160416  ORF Transcript_62210/g.160416 Transcript_62210/m.160416 type:complete len:214 (+) Transcript_62210:382-1023(+)
MRSTNSPMSALCLSSSRTFSGSSLALSKYLAPWNPDTVVALMSPMLKYVCWRSMNLNAASPVLCTVSVVLRDSAATTIAYSNRYGCGHASCVAVFSSRPKTSLRSSDPSTGLASSSTFQVLLRAKPCCAISLIGVPNWGKTSGMPPRMALVPFKIALLEHQITSLPDAVTNFVTVAPKRYTSHVAPLACLILTTFWPCSFGTISMLTREVGNE